MHTAEFLAASDGHSLVRFLSDKPTVFTPAETYISISVRRVSLAKGKINLSKHGPYIFGVLGQTNFDEQTRLAGVFSPAVEDALIGNMAGASAHAGSQVGAPLPHYEGRAGAPMHAESFRRLDRVLLVDKQLTPRLVFRGAGPIQIGFGGVLQKDYLADTLSMLEAVVKSPIAQFVSATAPALGLGRQALDVADTVKTAFDALSDKKGMVRLALLDMDLSALFTPAGDLPAGHYALIADDDVPSDLSVDAASGALTRKGRNWDGAPYVVFELNCESTRPDWGSVPEVNTAWRTLEAQILAGDTASALEGFRRSVFLSPDLVPADSRRIYAAARKKVEPLMTNAESFGLLGRLGTAGVFLKQAYDELKASDPVTSVTSEYDRFVKCHHIMRVNEGGYVDHPDDPGGATNMGVTQRTYDAWRTQQGKPRRHVRDITEVEVQTIYYEGYWRAGHCHRMPTDATALVLFDACVNHGHTPAMKFMQRGAGLPAHSVDGVFGPQTEGAILAMDPAILVRRALDARWDFFERIMARNSRLESFRRGWRNRVDHLRAITHGWTSGQESAGAMGLSPLSPDEIAAPLFGVNSNGETGA
ncbi:MAG: glycosyl hydrolase 108 family protein [Pseudomonadota bacterium]